MIFLSVKRILKAGFLNFWRNGFVSLSSVLVMTVTVFVIGSLVFNSILLNASLIELKDKVDINVYFVTTATEAEVRSVEKNIEQFPEIASVEYISREQALADFKERHKDDAPTLQALEELGENPLGAVLNVKAKEPSQYASVTKYLEEEPILSKDGKKIIDNINYNQNKVAIDRLTTIIDTSEKSNWAKTIILIIVSMVVTFNTIRLAIYISREEIAVMRLVGATYKYIRGPFVIVGILYGFISGAIAVALFYPLTYWFGPLFYPLPLFFSEKVGNLTLFDYYTQNFGQIFLIIIGAGVVLGAASSYLAVRRYLKV